jgi:CrcB protein
MLHSINTEVPWGILAVNLGGSFVMGLLIGADAATVPVAIGGVGTLTTWSGFITGLLEEQQERSRIVLNLVVSIGGGVTLAWAGLHLGG